MAVTMDHASKLILIKATSLLEQGWCQGRYYKTIEGKTYYCALGALCIAQRDLGYGYGPEVIHNAIRKIVKIINIEEIKLTPWNDDPYRTKQEVVDAFKKAQEL